MIHYYSCSDELISMLKVVQKWKKASYNEHVHTHKTTSSINKNNIFIKNFNVKHEREGGRDVDN